MLHLYTITTPKPIPCLGNITGPITNPVKLSLPNVMKLLSNGYEVYQHNPADKRERVKVTIENVNTIHFTKTKNEVVQNRVLNREIKKEQEPMNVKVIRDEKPVEKPSKNDEKSTNVKGNEKPINKPDAFKIS